MAIEIGGPTLEKLRTKLQFKVRYHLGSQCPDVEDVVQETLSRILDAAHRNRIRDPERLAAFANATCMNVIHEYRRGIWRDTPLESGELQPNPMENAAHTAEVRHFVTQVLSGLPERDRMLLEAFYIEEKSAEAIAAEWGLSDTGFRVALFRARERFRQIVECSLKPRLPESH